MQVTEENKHLRILHVMGNFGGGISSFILNKAKLMPKYGITFDIATYDECSQEFETAIQATGGKIYPLVNPKKEGYKSFSKTFSKPFEDNKYDLVHCHVEGYRAIPYYKIARNYGVKRFYIHAHHANDYKVKSVKDQLMFKMEQTINTKLSTAAVGCGRIAIKSVYGPKTNLNNAMVIPNSIDVEEYNHSEENFQHVREKGRSDFGISDDTILIGHVGRLVPVKNHEKTLEIAKYIKDKQINAKILVTGAGHLESSLKEKVETQGLESIITFTGRISPISEYYPALDVLLLPSFSEGLPTTVVEVQGAGVSTVMSKAITSEVDLGLNLVEQVSLDTPVSEWVDTLVKMSQQPVPNVQARINAIKEKGFSNEASAKLYVDYFTGKINAFQI